jgi:hypothetical protein
VDGPHSFLGPMSSITWHGNVQSHLAHGTGLQRPASPGTRHGSTSGRGSVVGSHGSTSGAIRAIPGKRENRPLPIARFPWVSTRRSASVASTCACVSNGARRRPTPGARYRGCRPAQHPLFERIRTVSSSEHSWGAGLSGSRWSQAIGTLSSVATSLSADGATAADREIE